MAVVRRAAIKQKNANLVLFYFYFNFIAVVRAGLESVIVGNALTVSVFAYCIVCMS